MWPLFIHHYQIQGTKVASKVEKSEIYIKFIVIILPQMNFQRVVEFAVLSILQQYPREEKLKRGEVCFLCCSMRTLTLIFLYTNKKCHRFSLLSGIMVFELTANDAEKSVFSDVRESMSLHKFICSSSSSPAKLMTEMTDQSRDTRASFLRRVVCEKSERISLEHVVEMWNKQAGEIVMTEKHEN